MATPPIHATHACPVCGGVITARRCPTAHRRMFVCECGYRERLPLSLRLREAGWKELPLFEDAGLLYTHEGEHDHAELKN